MTVLTVLGTRPEIIKLSPLLPRLDELGHHVIVHSGQHYSVEMDQVFFDELGLRAPDVSLGVGSVSPAAQVGQIAEGVEKAILETNPDWVIVHGDTNTTLGGALAAAKHRQYGVRLAHVEAGARSFNDLQPEELNRVLVDHMSDVLLAPTNYDARNLEKEGISSLRVVVTGNTVVESCQRIAALIDGPPPGLESDSYLVATMHRQEAVDKPDVLRELWNALSGLSEDIPIVLPLHPRTRSRLLAAEINESESPEGLMVMEPVGYRQMVQLLKHCRFCLTDSGGLQEEAAVLGVPALVLREETEHTRYVDCGLHRLTGLNGSSIRGAAQILMDDDELEARRLVSVPLDEGVTDRILAALAE